MSLPPSDYSEVFHLRIRFEFYLTVGSLETVNKTFLLFVGFGFNGYVHNM